MSPLFSLRRWLSLLRTTSRPRGTVDPRLGRRLLLEKLESRLPPGDLFGLAAPRLPALFEFPSPLPRPLVSHVSMAYPARTPPPSGVPLGSAAALSLVTPPSVAPTRIVSPSPSAPPINSATSPSVVDPNSFVPPPMKGFSRPSDPNPASSGGGSTGSGGSIGSNGLGPVGSTSGNSRSGLVTPTPPAGNKNIGNVNIGNVGNLSDPTFNGGSGGSGIGSSVGSRGLGGSGSGVSTGGNPGTGAGAQPLVTLTGLIDGNGRSVVNLSTNYTTPTLLGHATANASVTVMTDGRLAGRVTATRTGTFSFRSPALTAGTHVFVAAVTGSSGNAAPGLSTTVETVAPTVSLTGNDFVGARDTAWVKASVTSAAGTAFNSTVYIDVDLHHDGKFTDAGDQNVAVGIAGSTFDLPILPEGTYSIRARQSDFAGNVGYSNIITMQFDPNAGFLGSQYLRELGGLPPLVNGRPPDLPLGVGTSGLAGPGTPGTPGSGMPGSPSTMGNPSAVDYATLFAPFLFISSETVKISARSTLPKYFAGFEADLKRMRFQLLDATPSANMVTGYLPISQLAVLDKMAHLSTAVPVYRPELHIGSVQTEGDAVMLAPAFRASQGVDGTGVKVGVLSDSVNEFKGGLAASVASGNLPNNVAVLQDDPGGKGTDEGRAMLEIIHDVAPGSPLAFHTASNSPANFAAGILALKAAGAKVITDDIGYADEPIFNDGRIAQAVNTVAAQGVVYTSAAGNSGNQAYRADWSPVKATVDSVTNGTFQSFGGSALEGFTLAKGDTVQLTFQWDNAFLEGGDPAANFQVGTDFAVYVVDQVTGKILATQDDNNATTDEAVEFLSYANTTSDTNLALAFQLKSGPAPTHVAWVDFGSTNNLTAVSEGASTIFGHPVAAGAIAVAATPASTPSTEEPFSALGGALPILFDSLGKRLATPDIRNKPELTAPDGVHTSFFDSPDGKGGFLFFGTSAAAPHAAAAAALLLQQAPSATNVQLEAHLEQSAKDLDTPGYDIHTGFGLIQLTPLVLSSGGNGSANDNNDTSDVASYLGLIGSSTGSFPNLSIANHSNGLRDYDWYKCIAANGGAVNVGMDNPNLELHVFLFNGTYLTEVGNGTSVSAGQWVYIEVKGKPTGPGTSSQGAYNLTVKIG